MLDNEPGSAQEFLLVLCIGITTEIVAWKESVSSAVLSLWPHESTLQTNSLQIRPIHTSIPTHH